MDGKFLLDRDRKSMKRIPHVFEFAIRNYPCSIQVYKCNDYLIADLDVNGATMRDGGPINHVITDKTVTGSY
jgi:hypothetical protein